MSYLCGCYYHVASTEYHIRIQKHYLPLLDSTVHSTILSTTSRTVLKQEFTNPSSTEAIKECIYTFPLYDGVSVVSFTCRIGKKVLRGLVKEKVKAKRIFDDAVAKGETAGLLEQAPEASDVFSTKLGNIPAGQSVIVEITYIGELKHHETDGIRFTIPTKIAPRYGSGPAQRPILQAQDGAGIKITVDVNMPEGAFIKAVQSPSHPISVSMGTVSTASSADPLMSKASATLSLGSTNLDQDFVLIVQSKDVGMPKAILEIHPTIRNHRAIMATLVPKFSLPPSRPEIVFVADRSGSMQYNMAMLISAMQVFLKSMPVGVKFNICSFGSSHSFLWAKSQSYNQETLQQANDHLLHFQSDMGGTETFGAIQATIERRYTDIPLEIILLTDGDIWRQEDLFKYVNQQVEQTNGNIRIFPLGIGNGVSHALIEGLARAGNGFAQAVQIGERLENCVVRMLRGALSPHITDYTLEVKYEKENDDFELVDRVTEGMKILLSDDDKAATKEEKPTISLFDSNVDPEKEKLKGLQDSQFWLPTVPCPKLCQAPHKIPTLFPFSRTSVYLLMSPETIQRNPTAVILRATSSHGPLALEIPVEALSTPAETIHQLAARKAVQDLEEGRGWIYDAKDQNDKLIKDRYPSCFEDLVQREAVRLGEKFQIAGKWCSFVAVAANDKEIAEKEKKDIEQKSLVTDEDGDIYSGEFDRLIFESFLPFSDANTNICAQIDDDMDIQGDLEASDDDEGFMMVGGSSVPAPPYQPINRSVKSRSSRRCRVRTQPEENSVDRRLPHNSSLVSAYSSMPTASSQSTTLFGQVANQSIFGGSSTQAPSSLFSIPAAQQAQQAQYQPFGSTAPFICHASTSQPSNLSNEKVLLPQAPQASGRGRAAGFSGRFQQARFPAGPSPFQDQATASGFGSQPAAFGSATGNSSVSPQGAFSPLTPPGSQPSGRASSLFGTANTGTQGTGSPIEYSAKTSHQSRPVSPHASIGRGPSNLFGGIQETAYSTSPSHNLVNSTADSSNVADDTSAPLAGAPQIAARRTVQVPARTFLMAASITDSPASSTPPPPPAPAPAQASLFGSLRTNPSVQAQRSASDGLNGSLAASLQKRKSVARKEWAGKSISEKVLAIIALQTFEGSWTDEDEVIEIMGIGRGVVEKAGVERKVWVTVLVVRWLETRCAEEEGTWGLVVEKARGWLEGLGVMDLEALEKEAGALVENSVVFD
jgi:hypothetical protein